MYIADDADCDDDGGCLCRSGAVDFLELFPNSNLRRISSLTVITLCRRITSETLEKKSEEAAADSGLLVDVSNSGAKWLKLNCLTVLWLTVFHAVFTKALKEVLISDEIVAICKAVASYGCPDLISA